MERFYRWCETIFHFILVLLIIRAVAYAVGFTTKVPIIDPIIDVIYRTVKDIAFLIGKSLHL